MQRMTYRSIQHFLLFLTILCLVFAFYGEYIDKIQPCPLCLMQRFCAFIFGFFCLAALSLRTLHRARILACIQVVIAGVGLYFAARQLWIQTIPFAEAQVCMPAVDYLIKYSSFGTILKAFFWGSSDCTKAASIWLGLPIPVWSSVYFLIMMVTNVVLAILLNLSLKKAETNALQ